ncbi:CD276 antigen homolog isoform X2 [Heterodontus francisci]
MKNWLVGLHLVMSCVGAAQGYPSVLGIIGKQVMLPCSYSMTKGRTAPNLRVLWQTEGDDLVHAQYGESERNEFQNARYRNRTRVSVEKVAQGNLSLVLSAVGLADEGAYKCIVLRKSGTEHQKVQETNVALVTAADYSSPVLSGPDMKDIRAGEAVNLTCHSSSGYPQPVVNWTDGRGNSLPEHSQVETRMDPDPVSRLWNVTSVLRIIVMVDATFTCSIYNIRTGQTKTSDRWKCERQITQDNTNLAPIVAALLTGVVLALAVGLILYRRIKMQMIYSVTSSHENCLNDNPWVSNPHEREENCLEEDRL